MPGAVTTFAGGGGLITSGYADGSGTNALFNNPSGVATDNAGLVFVADLGNNLVRTISLTTFAVSTLAGGGSTGGVGSGYANGIGSASLFDRPTGVAAAEGVVFVADAGNRLVRKIDVATQAVSTLAGGAGDLAGGLSGNLVDGLGTTAGFNSLWSIAADPTGRNVYVAEYLSGMVRIVDAVSGLVTSLPVSSKSGPTSMAITVDWSGHAFVSYLDDSLFKINLATKNVSVAIPRRSTAVDRKSVV